MRRTLAGILTALLVLTALPAVAAENINVTLKGKAYDTKWGIFENCIMTLKGEEVEKVENAHWENLQVVIRVPSRDRIMRFGAQGLRVHYHVEMSSTENLENAFGLIPPYARDLGNPYMSDYGYGRWANKFGSDFPRTAPYEEKHARLGGASFSGYKIENYWYLSGTIVHDQGDNIFDTYSTTAFIMENNGNMGSLPSANSFSGYVRQFTYLRVRIISEILDLLDSTNFWQSWSSYLYDVYDIVEQVRNTINEYVP